MNYDNPAYRLLVLLERGKTFKLNRNCREAWEELLEVQGNSALLMSRLSKVMALPQTIVVEIQNAYPNHGNTWSHWEGQVSAAFMVQNMHGEWGTFINHIDAHTFTYLKLASELLNSASKARLQESESVTSVHEKVSSILNDVLSSDLSTALKSQVVRCLRKILDALEEYRITGGIGVLEAAEAALGHSSLDSEYRSFLTDTDLGRQVLDGISTAANLLTISLSLPALTVALTPLLK